MPSKSRANPDLHQLPTAHMQETNPPLHVPRYRRRAKHRSRRNAKAASGREMAMTSGHRLSLPMSDGDTLSPAKGARLFQRDPTSEPMASATSHEAPPRFRRRGPMSSVEVVLDPCISRRMSASTSSRSTPYRSLDAARTVPGLLRGSIW